MAVNDMENTGMEQQPGYTPEGGEPGALENLGDDGYGADNVDALIVEEPPKKKHTGAIVLIVVVGLAVGSLFSMHTLTKVTASQGRNAETERTIDSFLSSMTGTGRPNDNGESSTELVEGHREVVDVLSDDYMSHQVSDLNRNPFNVVTRPVNVPAGPVDDSEYAKAMRRDAMEEAAEEFELKSIIMGTRPLANLNGRIVRVNQVVPVQSAQAGGVIKFRVASIREDAVTMVAEDPALEIRVEKVLEWKR
jgi:hypothetical protein